MNSHSLLRLVQPTPLSLVAALLLAPVAQGQLLLTRWDFNSGSLSPQTGSGEARLVGGTSATFAAGYEGEASGAWNLKAFPAQGTLPGTAGAEFSLSTTDAASVTVSFQIRHSNTSANTERVLWSTDGQVFTEATRFAVTPAISGSGETWYQRRVEPALRSGPPSPTGRTHRLGLRLGSRRPVRGVTTGLQLLDFGHVAVR